MDKVELKKLLNEKGVHWPLSSLIEGSIGYHTPEHAKAQIGCSWNIHQNHAPKPASAASFPHVLRQVWERAGLLAWLSGFGK